jgi:Uma2 family endonuclease
MPVRTLMTAEQFDALPESESRKWELLDGELIEAPTATPERNLILGRLFFLLYSFVRPRKFGQLLLRIDLAVRPDSRLRADLALFSSQIWRYAEIDRAPMEQPPYIAIEIISPAETATVVNRKVQALLAWQVHEVWLIYPETRTVEVQVPASARIFNNNELIVSSRIPGWRIWVSEIFEELESAQ